MGIRYECNVCGELIEDEENMVWHDTTHQVCKGCNDKEEDDEKNEREEIDKIIESLNGTCNSLDTEEYLANGFSEDNLTQAIDEAIVLCEQCGWWVEACEVNDDNVCNDCSHE